MFMKKLMAVLMLSLLVYSGYIVAGFAAADEVYTNKVVTVYSGDTMWDIAAGLAEEGEDVRAVLYRIREANNLTGADLQPGQKLLVPVRVNAGDGVMLAEAAGRR